MSDPTLDRIADRLEDLATSCSVMDNKLDKVRLEQSVQAERWIQHERRHDGIDRKIDGIETREREDATGRVDAHGKPSKPPPLIDAKRLREWFLLAAIIAAAVLSVWTSATTPTKADVTTAVEEQTKPLDRVAKTIETLIAEVQAEQDAAEPVAAAPAPVFPETVVTP